MPLHTTVDGPPELNLIPMIDIMFNLMIFFLVGTEFASLERNVSLQVPEVVDRGALTAAPERRVVNVYRDGAITLDEKDVSLRELVSRLSAARLQYADLGVLVRGDGQGEFQRVAEVLNACKQAGIQELGISVRIVSEEKTN